MLPGLRLPGLAIAGNVRVRPKRLVVVMEPSELLGLMPCIGKDDVDATPFLPDLRVDTVKISDLCDVALDGPHPTCINPKSRRIVIMLFTTVE
jgi:hypothetical protein